MIMADAFKPTYKKPLPEGKTIHEEKLDGQWKQFIKLKDSRGRETKGYLTDDKMSRLLDATLKRPLEQYLKQGHKLKSAARRKLQRRGEERRLIYTLMLYTGLRVNETRQLQWSDVNLNAPEPYFRVRASITKNSKDANLPLHVWLITLLKEWKVKNPGVGKACPIVKVPVSSSLLKVLNADLEWAKIAKTDEDGKVVHLHAQRHTFISHLANKGVQPNVVKNLARHAKLEMTTVYTHVPDSMEHMAIQGLATPKAILSKEQASGMGGHAIATDPHVRIHVQNPDFDRVSLGSVGTDCPNGSKKKTSDSRRRQDAKPLNGGMLGTKKAPLSPSDIGAIQMGGIGLEPTTSCVSKLHTKHSDFFIFRSPRHSETSKPLHY
jgi:integrase